MKIKEFINYEQPNDYIVSSEHYNQINKVPVLTAGQSFVLGFTDDKDGIYTKGNCIIFDDFTTSVHYVDFPFKVKSSAMKILTTNKNADLKYCYYLLLSISKMPTNHKRQWISTTSEKEWKLPAFEKQKSIADILDSLTATINDYKKEINMLDNLIKARFIELFGDPQCNPHGYKHTKLSDIATYYNGLTYKPENVAEEGTIVLRSSNIQNSQLDFVDTVRVDCAIKELLMVQKNDILMCSRNGSAKLVGKVALIKNIQEPMSFGAFMMIIRSNYFGYLMTYFQMDAFRQQIKTGATTTINQITGRMLDDVTIPLPPMVLVDQFVAFVEQVDKSKFIQMIVQYK